MFLYRGRRWSAVSSTSIATGCSGPWSAWHVGLASPSGAARAVWVGRSRRTGAPRGVQGVLGGSGSASSGGDRISTAARRRVLPLTVVLARVTARAGASPPPAPAGSSGRWRSGLPRPHVQIVLGALLTHGGWVGLHLAGGGRRLRVRAIVTRGPGDGQPAFAPGGAGAPRPALVQLLLGAGTFVRASRLALRRPGDGGSRCRCPPAGGRADPGQVAALVPCSPGRGAPPSRLAEGRLETVTLRSAP